MSGPTRHVVHTVLHRPLTLWQVDRRLVGGAIGAGLLVLNVPPRNALLALGVTLALYGLAWWATQKDPQIVEIVRKSWHFKTWYDPLKHDPFDVKVQ